MDIKGKICNLNKQLNRLDLEILKMHEEVY